MWRLWDSWPDHVMRPGDRGSHRARYRTEVSPQYFPWFQRLTHPRVSPAAAADDDDDDDPDVTSPTPAAVSIFDICISSIFFLDHIKYIHARFLQRLQRMAGVLHPFHPHRRRQDQRLQHECPYRQAIDTLCEQVEDMIGPSGDDDTRGGHPGAGSSGSWWGDYETSSFSVWIITFYFWMIVSAFYLFMTAFIYL
ncbi:hypothetical protein Dimus_038391 [Dionaea muscipula]